MTGPRRLIISVLESADEYMSAEEVYMEVYRQSPGIGIATVYRTLQLLTEVGTAQRVDTGDGKARYKLAPADARRRRVVLVCTNCSRTIPVTTLAEPDRQRIAELEESMRRNHAFVTHHTVTQLFGECSECAGSHPNGDTVGSDSGGETPEPSARRDSDTDSNGGE
jgi:Fur family ferric uptake transcriptional regulator